MAIVAVGIDLAKNVLALHGANDGEVVQLHQPNGARHQLAEVVTAPSVVRQ